MYITVFLKLYEMMYINYSQNLAYIDINGFILTNMI